MIKNGPLLAILIVCIASIEVTFASKEPTKLVSDSFVSAGFGKFYLLYRHKINRLNSFVLKIDPLFRLYSIGKRCAQGISHMTRATQGCIRNAAQSVCESNMDARAYFSALNIIMIYVIDHTFRGYGVILRQC